MKRRFYFDSCFADLLVGVARAVYIIGLVDCSPVFSSKASAVLIMLNAFFELAMVGRNVSNF
jgi:hypothetical protein